MVKVALLIGVSEYEPGLNPLPESAKDVEAMQQVLQQSEMGGFDEVRTLPNPDPLAMQEAIETLFSGRVKDDLALLFFSGHGVKDDSGRLYFATRITRKNSRGELVKATAVPASFVHEIMSNSRSRRQVVILDCCFSGAFAEGLSAKDDGSVDVKNQLGGEGRAVLTSSTATQYSFEQQGSALSIYTRYIVEGIRTGAADKDKDGVISVDDLHEYAKEKVQAASPAMKPEIYAIKEGFKILLAKVAIDDPKLKYRQQAQQLASHGEFSIVGRRILNQLRADLKLPKEEVDVIEADVMQPYRERQRKLQEYEQAFVEAIKQEYPLRDYTLNELKNFQQILNLIDEDVALIEARIISEKRSPATDQDALSTEPIRLAPRDVEMSNEIVSLATKPTTTASLSNDLSAKQKVDYAQLSASKPQSSLTKSIQVKNKLIVGVAVLVLGLGGYPIYKYLEKLSNSRPETQLAPPSVPSSSPTDNLKSDQEVNYTRLRDLLAAENWKEADEETARVMLSVAHQNSSLDSTSITNFPCTDLRTIDNLWVKYSKGHFGFSVQKRIFDELNGTLKEYRNSDAQKFGDRVGWRVNSQWIQKPYNNLTSFQKAPDGRFPTQPGLRAGTQGILYLAPRLAICRI